jgi:hypothetical protein
MVRSYGYPDLLIDPLPDLIRDAYDAAESVLFEAEHVVYTIAGDRADLLPQVMGNFLSLMTLAAASVRASETELAPARRSGPFVAMGRTYTTAHLAALDCGQSIAYAVCEAADPGDTYDNTYEVDAWVLKGASDRSEEVKQNLVSHGVLTPEGGPGPRWRAFRTGFHKLLHQLMPDDQPEDLQTAMRLEVAEWAKGQRSNRLTIDLESNSLTLDGILHADLDPIGLRIIDALEKELRSGNLVVSGSRLSELVPGCRGGEKAVRRKLAKLPKAIRSLVKALPGKGHWLQLPPR